MVLREWLQEQDWCWEIYQVPGLPLTGHIWRKGNLVAGHIANGDDALAWATVKMLGLEVKE